VEISQTSAPACCLSRIALETAPLLRLVLALLPSPCCIMSSQEQHQKQSKDYTDEVAKAVPQFLAPLEGGKKVSAGKQIAVLKAT
jgi:hypothetical protein